VEVKDLGEKAVEEIAVGKVMPFVVAIGRVEDQGQT